MINSKSTMVEGWPDAIRCGADNGEAPKAMFIFHGGAYRYDQVYALEMRSVSFNKDGTYNSKTGHDDSSRGCLGQSISQLYASGRAFNFVTSKVADSTGATTMFQGWPDAIRCGADNGEAPKAMFIFHGGAYRYDQVYALEMRSVSFNKDGTYNSKTGHDDSSRGCLGQSISQLYASGRAFNFVTSKEQYETSPSDNSTSPSNNTIPSTNSTSPSNNTIPSTNSTPPSNNTSSVGDSCLKLKTLSLGSVGDLDRKNEEIELEITSLGTQMECGLFIFDITKNIKDKNFNINIPCNSGGFVDVRFIERDNCNDDTTLSKIQCIATSNAVQLPIRITSDATVTGYDECVRFSNTNTACVKVGTGTIGGSFCSKFEWGKEECATKQVSETTSEYVLVYEVVKQGCSIGSNSLQKNETCYIDSHYNPGPTCTDLSTLPSEPSDAMTLSSASLVMALVLGVLFY